jgi:hypothetical protein
LGVFSVHMPLIYGEGRDAAFLRLHEEIEKLHKGTLFFTSSAVCKEIQMCSRATKCTN